MFWLFMGEDYYPRGGYNDFHGSFDTLEEAQSVAVEEVRDKEDSDWAHVLEIRDSKPFRLWSLTRGMYEWAEAQQPD